MVTALARLRRDRSGLSLGDPALEPWRVQSGIEYESGPGPCGRRFGCYAAVDVSTMEERNWRVDVTVTSGSSAGRGTDVSDFSRMARRPSNRERILQGLAVEPQPGPQDRFVATPPVTLAPVAALPVRRRDGVQRSVRDMRKILSTVGLLVPLTLFAQSSTPTIRRG